MTADEALMGWKVAGSKWRFLIPLSAARTSGLNVAVVGRATAFCKSASWALLSALSISWARPWGRGAADAVGRAFTGGADVAPLGAAVDGDAAPVGGGGGASPVHPERATEAVRIPESRQQRMAAIAVTAATPTAGRGPDHR